MFKSTHLVTGLLLIQLNACGGDAGSPLGSAGDIAEGTKTSALLGSVACKNVEITVKNSFFYDGRQREIQVLYVTFRSASEGTWLTEGLGNIDLAYGHQHTWQNQDLAHAENDLITKWRVYFRYRESDGDLSDTVYMELDTPNDTCHADDNYSLTVG